MKKLAYLAVLGSLSMAPQLVAAAGPLYKSSSFAEAEDIMQDHYGASELAPEALQLGTQVPDFSLTKAGGGQFSLSKATATGPVVIVFYRSHW